jgi:hypothetical protein
MNEVQELIMHIEKKIKEQTTEIDNLHKELELKKITLNNEIQSMERIMSAARKPINMCDDQ